MMHKLEGLKIVSAQELQRVEKESLDEGFKEKSYIEKAGLEISEILLEFQKKNHLQKKVLLLAGKGNNGADGFSAALCLIKKGFAVKALCPYEVKECSYYNKIFREEFLRQGGELAHFSSQEDFVLSGQEIILDGLVGSGFEGSTEGKLATLIESANSQSLPIFAIDIPSGLNGTTGEASLFCIKATITICLGAPKAGFFVENGYDYIGKLEFADFGLLPKFLDRALPFGFILDEKSVKHLLVDPHKTQDKYERGYVVAIGGSKGMEGAALLSTLAAFRSGAGIVRLFSSVSSFGTCFEDYPELIKSPLSDEALLSHELTKASSVLIGPGISHIDEIEEKKLLDTIENLNAPLIVDAMVTSFFSHKLKKWPLKTILTPHRGEAKKLLGIAGAIKDEDLFEKCQDFVEEKKVVLVLKGAPTILFESKKPLLVIARGDPGMATAGSGDVLSGVIAAMLTKGISAKEAAALGVYIHALAGEDSAKEKSSFSVMAQDLIDHLPKALQTITDDF